MQPYSGMDAVQGALDYMSFSTALYGESDLYTWPPSAEAEKRLYFQNPLAIWPGPTYAKKTASGRQQEPPDHSFANHPNVKIPSKTSSPNSPAATFSYLDINTKNDLFCFVRRVNSV